ncbi:polyketide synthase [Fusarium heterosporum]|uniref:Polyketide synthase n=1 Tax=Fusarium heterosporum TaxID=42747 RepID=A0A8H5SL78_FUSHE|nr:polyketide synthase [Fusarium heterosporum]
MNHPSGHRKAAYMNAYCRHVFSLLENSHLSQQKPIRHAIRIHAVVVADFTEQKLVEIVQYLIGQGVFRSPVAAAYEFPDLRDPNIAGAQSPVEPPTECQARKMVTFDLSWLRSSFDDNGYADLTLISCAKQYSAHRVIVCLQSSVITRKLLSQFQSTKQDPSCDSCGASPGYYFDFLDDDPQAVDCLIQYFYRQDYRGSCYSPKVKDAESCDAGHEVSVSLSEQDDIDDSYPILHVRVYALAELYGILTLKRLALEKFNKTIQENVRIGRQLEEPECSIIIIR